MKKIHPAKDARFRRASARPRRRRPAVAVLRHLVHGLLLGAVVALGTHWAPGFLERSRILHIDTVAVKGNRHLSSGEVAAMLGPLEEDSILTADLEAYRERLLTSGWVESATLRRLLPSTVEVTLAEREPVGLARVASRLYLIDGSGTLIDEYGPTRSDFRLPIIDGLQPRGVRDGGRGERAQLVARLTAALRARPDLSAQVSQIDVADARDAVVLLNDEPTLLHLGNDQFVERLERYLEVAPALHDRVPELDHVDLRFDQHLYVRSAGEAGRP